MTQLEEEFQYYLCHQDELVEKHEGQYVVVKDSQILGFYDSEVEAIENTQRDHKLGTFLVQRCEPGSQNYTEVFHSRVVIV